MNDQPTTQELFDRVRDHLLTQNARSAIGASCQYRGPGGLKCAIGALIDDALYHPDIETGSVYTDDVRHALWASIGRALTEEEMDLLDSLQTLHDISDPPTWGPALNDIATGRGLQP